MKRIDPELRLIRYFLAVADELHFGRAARRLHVSQPSVSRGIQSLEESLGVELFARTARNVQLTAAGEALRTHIPRALDELAQAIRETREAAATDHAMLAVSYLPSARPLVLEAARQYRGRFHTVHLTLTEELNEQQYLNLVEGTLDISIVRGDHADPRLVAQTLVRLHLCVALPPQHPLASQPEVDYCDLRHEDFVLWPRAESPESFDRVIAGCQLAGFHPRIVAESGDPQTVASLVEAGWGVSILGSSLRDVVDADIAFVPLRGETDPLSVMWRVGHASPTSKNFVDLLLDVAHRATANGHHRKQAYSPH